MINPHSKCSKGEHTFIVHTTQKAGVKDFATQYVCQHCLLLVDAQMAQNTYATRKKEHDNA